MRGRNPQRPKQQTSDKENTTTKRNADKEKEDGTKMRAGMIVLFMIPICQRCLWGK